MDRIVSSITTIEHHCNAISQTPEAYRPPCCPHCGLKVLWRHGYYYRKADRGRQGEASLNPVPICRYCCSGCRRTCSRLPLCIAPRRWYDWVVQQGVLLLLLSGYSLHRCSRCTCFDRRTVRRWRDWLNSRTDTFAFFLRNRFPEWGRSAEGADFWRTVLSQMPLANVMAWLDRDLIIP
jgi:transposase-like protein